jgi:DNA (cytosine-5)-methyltransferase 1
MSTRSTNSARKPLNVAVLDLFAGCGGASTGFKMAGVKGVRQTVVAGVDIDGHCCATYRRMVGAPAMQLDIRQLVEDESAIRDLQRSLRLNSFDRLIVIGCSPCQGFAAHRHNSTDEDPRRNLFVIQAQLIARLRPDAVFMENVPDLLSDKHWRYFALAMDILQKAGLHTHAEVHNCAEYGLPQERFRAVVLAARFPLTSPRPVRNASQFVTVRDAIGTLPVITPSQPDPNDPMHRTSEHRPSTIAILRAVPKNGGNRPPGIGPKCLDRARQSHGGYTDVYGRLAWDRPAVTLTAKCRTPSAGRFAHPEQDRGLSIREAALLQGFPPDFVFEGTFDSKYMQIGNAVPPLVARHFAKHLLTALRDTPRGRKRGVPTARAGVSKPVPYGFTIRINGLKKARARIDGVS